MAVYEFSLNARAFAAMLDGRKTTEIRVSTQQEPFDYAALRAGDTLRFRSLADGAWLRCTLAGAAHYPHIEALLAAEGTAHTLSSTDDPEAGARSVRSFAGYGEGMEKNGVWALRIASPRRES